MSEKRKYSMLVFSNPLPGREEEYLEWYSGQHIHDLLGIPGFTGCRFYQMSEHQMFGSLADKKYRFLIVWDFETDDVEAMITEIKTRKADGRSKVCPAFDPDQGNFFCFAVTDYISSEMVTGLSVQEVKEISKLQERQKELVEEDRK